MGAGLTGCCSVVRLQRCDIFFDPATVEDGAASAPAFADVISSAGCAAADHRRIVDKDAVEEKRAGGAVVYGIVNAAAVACDVAFKAAIPDLRGALTVLTVVVDGAAVHMGFVLGKLAIQDGRAAFLGAGEVEHGGAPVGQVAPECAVADRRGSGFVVPSGAAGSCFAYAADCIGVAARDDKAVNDGLAANVFGCHYGVNIVRYLIFGADFAAQNGRIGGDIAIIQAGFDSGEATEEGNTLNQLEGCVAIRTGSRRMYAGCYPDLVACLCNGKCVLKIRSSCPGNSISGTAFFYVDRSCM